MTNLDDKVSASCRLNVVVFQDVDGDPGHDFFCFLGFAILYLLTFVPRIPKGNHKLPLASIPAQRVIRSGGNCSLLVFQVTGQTYDSKLPTMLVTVNRCFEI